jgi:hypothetical protein
MEVANLSDAARLKRVGLAPPVPGRPGWPAFQRVGEALWRDGWRGLLAPSAARRNGLVLGLFVEDPTSVPARPYGRRRIVKEPPAPPTGLRT